MNTLPADTPTHRRNISEMPADQLEELLVGIRERRMKAHNEYTATRKRIMAMRAEKLTAPVRKKLGMFEKKHDMVLKLIDDLESRVLHIRALELQIADAANDPVEETENGESEDE